MNFRRAVAALLAVGALSSCGGDGVGVASVLLVSAVEVTPHDGDLVLGGTAQLTATPRTATGVVVPGRTVIWASTNGSTVSVSSSGLITAVTLGGPVRITATVDGVQGEALITVRPTPVARVVIAPDQSSVPIGGSTELTATAYDGSGAALDGRLIFWQSSAPAVAAVTSTGLILGMAEGGPVTITATSEGKSGTALVSVLPRPPAKLGFLQQPGQATAGQAINPPVRVAIQNIQGGTVTGATNTVTIALGANPGGATLAGTTTVPAVNGVATFTNLSLDRAAAGYTLTATSDGLSLATSTAFTNVAGAASQLTFATAPPTSASSAQPLVPQPALQLRDGFGNPVSQAGVVVTASVTTGTATLGGSTSATTGATGVATFSTLSLTGNGGVVTLTFAAPGITPIASAPISLSSGAAVALAMVTQPSATAVSGVPLVVQPAVKRQDAGGNDVSGAGASIVASIATGPAGGTLGGTTTVQTAANGTAQFTNLVISGPAGSYELRFSSGALAPVTSNSIVVTVGQAHHLSITTQPSSSAMTGTAFAQQPVLQLRDGGGNAVNQSGVAVTVAIASGGGTLGGTTTVTTNASGTATFTNLSISGTVGSKTLGFSSAGIQGVTSGTINITAGPPTQLTVTTQPSSSASNGAAFAQQPVIQLRDAGGNPVSQAGVMVNANIASGGGTLGGTASVATDATGAARFTDLSITGTIGNRTLGFSAPSLTGATSATVTLTAGPASQLSITIQPSSIALSGVQLQRQPAIQLRDVSGNLVQTAGVPVVVDINFGPGSLGGTLTRLTNASGLATFTNLVLTGAGSYTLRFSSGSLTDAVSIGILVF